MEGKRKEAGRQGWAAEGGKESRGKAKAGKVGRDDEGREGGERG